MKYHLPLILLLSLPGCNAIQSAVDKARTALTGKAPITLPVDDSATYKATPPPALENDKVVQFTPKDRLIALFSQFNSQPDDAQLALLSEEFMKNKQLFGMQRDDALVSMVNGTIGNIQEKDKNTIQLLVQLHGILLGKNLEHLRTVLGRGFDHAPTLTISLLNKFEQDKNCSMVMVIPQDIPVEERFSYLENRLSVMTPARLVPGQTQLYLPYIDTCIQQLQMEVTRERPAVDTTSTDMATDSPAQPTSTELTPNP